jgi:HEAT repeat protein
VPHFDVAPYAMLANCHRSKLPPQLWVNGMKQPSDTTRAWIQEIQSTFSNNPSNTPSAKAVAHWVDGLVRIGISGDWTAIPYVVPYLASKNHDVSAAAAAALQKLVMNMRPASLVELDDRLRVGMWSIPTYLLNWDRLTVDEATSIMARYNSSAIAGLLSFHGNGYVRQSAILELGEMCTGSELSFLLIRLTDWVEPVYKHAAREIASRINNNYLYHFIDNLAVLQRIAARERAAQRSRRAQIVADIENLLLRPENRTVMIDALKHTDPNVRRYVLKLLSIVPGEDLPVILRAAVGDSDIRNRRMVLNFSERLNPDERVAMLWEMSLRDSAPALRLDALQQLVDVSVGAAAARELLVGALSDAGTSVREYARWRLGKDGGFDVRQYYLDGLLPTDGHATDVVNAKSAQPKRRAAMVLGLGEIGTRSDANLLSPFLDDESVRVRKATIQSLARLDAQSFLSRFYDLVGNEHPGISKAAMLGIQSSKMPIESDRLWEMFQSADPEHVRRNALRLLNESEKWDRLTYLMMAVSRVEVNDPSYENAVHFVGTWLSQYRDTWRYTLPTEKQRERYLEAVRNATDRLPVELYMQIPKSF